MLTVIDNIRKTRLYLLDLVKDLSTEQLNEVPAGFSNNIIWNMGHMVAAMQGVCYKRAGLDHMMDLDFFESYKPGTKPDGDAPDEEVKLIKELLMSSTDQLGRDFDNGVFSGYTPWATRYGVPINNVEDAVAFIMYHEGLHTGIIMALKKLVSANVTA